ncbi:DUF202 domain-containing protein [Salmonella enterica subsp. diarizonae]|nr:DUF202 domain-containing protein [Salmonella enterica subsp. diarizonae]
MNKKSTPPSNQSDTKPGLQVERTLLSYQRTILSCIAFFSSKLLLSGHSVIYFFLAGFPFFLVIVIFTTYLSQKIKKNPSERLHYVFLLTLLASSLILLVSLSFMLSCLYPRV